MAVHWRGREIAAKAAHSAQLGIDATMAACVRHAKDDHGWQNQTGTAEGSIRVADPAVTAAGITSGKWGSVNVAYFIFLEFLIGEIMGDTGWTRTRKGGSPTLRPAADVEYPLLRARIHAAFEDRALP